MMVEEDKERYIEWLMIQAILVHKQVEANGECEVDNAIDLSANIP